MAETAPTSKTYEGQCHCGNISYSVDVTPPLESGHEVHSCNCSICVANGYLLIYVPDNKMDFHSGETKVKNYRFGERIEHSFCPNCGTSVYGKSIMPGFYEGVTAVNVRTFKGIDVDALNLKKVDGKSL